MRNAVLEGSRRGAAQAVLKAEFEESLSHFILQSKYCMKLFLHKYSQEGKREELKVLRASAGRE